MQSVAFLDVPKRPTGHLVQLGLPVSGANFPGVHPVQVSERSPEDRPTSQMEHSIAFPVENEPGSHAPQLVDPISWRVANPLPQATHSSAVAIGLGVGNKDRKN